MVGLNAYLIAQFQAKSKTLTEHSNRMDEMGETVSGTADAVTALTKRIGLTPGAMETSLEKRRCQLQLFHT